MTSYTVQRRTCDEKVAYKYCRKFLVATKARDTRHGWQCRSSFCNRQCRHPDTWPDLSPDNVCPQNNVKKTTDIVGRHDGLCVVGLPLTKIL